MIRSLLLASLPLVAAPAFAAPPIQSPLQAVARLRSAKTPAAAKAAVQAVGEACRGKLRHALRDHAGLRASAEKMATAEDPGVRKAALDLDRCFTPKTFAGVVGPRLSDEDPAVVVYAAEVAARLADPAVLPPLFAAHDARAPACLAPGLDPAAVEVCVWLTYAPGAALAGADEEARASAAERAVKMFEAPYPKVREVAVETVHSAGLKTYAKAIAKLVAAEKAGEFAQKNDAALLGRFEERRRALLKR